MATGSLKKLNSPSRIFCNRVGLGILVVVVVAAAVAVAVVIGVVGSFCNAVGEEVVKVENGL